METKSPEFGVEPALIMSEQYYIAVKASLHSTDSSVFGLDPVEISALSKRFPNSQTPVFNGVLIKGNVPQMCLQHFTKSQTKRTRQFYSIKQTFLWSVLLGTMSHSCNCSVQEAVHSVHQTLDELDFERGIWTAALDGDSDRIQQLLSKGTSVNATDNAGYTALHYAARAGNVRICELLIQAGANVNMATKAGQATPLHRAAMAGHENIVELLLKNGADCLQDGDGRTPLHRAVEARNPSVAKILVQHCSQLLQVLDNFNKLPLDYVCGNELLHNALHFLPQ